MSTIYNPVLDDAYFEKLKAPVTHKFLKGDHKVILAVGRLTEAKNFGFLIRSFKVLQDQNPETRLLILGEGELRAEFEDLVTDLGLKTWWICRALMPIHMLILNMHRYLF